jgi:hypothetical protein
LQAPATCNRGAINSDVRNKEASTSPTRQKLRGGLFKFPILLTRHRDTAARG